MARRSQDDAEPYSSDAVRLARDRAVEERVRKRLRRHFLLSYGSTALIAMLALLYIALDLADRDLAGYLAMLWFFLLILGGVALNRCRKQPQRRSVVLWVRRFHRGAQSRTEQRWLENAVYPWGTLVTLADSTIDCGAFFPTGIWALGILFVAMAIGGALGLWRYARYWGALISLLYALLVWLRAGRVELKSDNWTENLASLHYLLRYPDPDDDEPVLISGSVLNCPPDTDRWRNVIQMLATVADAAVISVPQNTSNVEWELSVLMASLGPAKMLLVANDNATRLTAEAEDMPKTIRIPEPASSWYGRYARTRRQARRSAMEAILRAIESYRPDPPKRSDRWSPMTRKLEAWLSSDEPG